MRSLLFITHEYPPLFGAGTPRVLAIAHQLPRFGWTPIVLTTRARGLEPSLPEGVLHRTRTLLTARSSGSLRRFGSRPGGREPKGVARAIRDRLLVPDARVLWWPFAFPAALRLVRRHRVAAILATAPPYSVLSLARLVHQRTGRPFIADFRDPWSHAFEEDRGGERPTRQARERDAEARVMATAAAITVTAPRLKHQLARTYPSRADHVHLVRNGYDAADYASIVPRKRKAISIAYTGKMTGPYSLRALFDALIAIRDHELTPLDDVGVEIVGEVDHKWIETATALGLDDLVAFHGVSDRAGSIAWQLGADVLYLTYPDELRDRASGKTYEYLYAGTPIIASVVPDSETAAIIRGAGGGVIVPPTDTRALADALADAIEAARREPEQADTRRADRRRDPRVTRYERSEQIAILAAVLDRVIGEGDGR